jgi:2-polyprenyl-3-methyl-5-hydroxy-6-metoxy-1,4-benzoquinol methylase
MESVLRTLPAANQWAYLVTMHFLPQRSGDTIAIPGDYQYRAAYHGWSPQRFWHQSRLRASAEMLSIQPGMRVLDVGCGSGVFASQVATGSQACVVGVDANVRAVEFARSQFVDPNLRFEVGNLSDLSFTDQSFERIALLEVIKHIHQYQVIDLLRALRSLLTPGGRLVISTPNALSAWPMIEWLLDHLRLVPHMRGEQHVARYHLESLRSVCEPLGFRLLESRTLFVISPLIAAMNWTLASRVLKVEQRGTRGSLLLQAYERI